MFGFCSSIACLAFMNQHSILNRNCSSVECLGYVPLYCISMNSNVPGRQKSYIANIVSVRLSERVWCTKILYSLKVTSISVGSSTRSYLFIPATVPKRQKVFTLQDWHKTYPVCDAPLSISGQRSFASSQKSLRHNRSCEWTEALSGKIFVAARKLSGIVRKQH